MNMLAFAGTLDPSLVSFIKIARIVLICIVVLACAIMIVTTLLQSSANQAGSSAISGTQESYFSQNRDNSKDGVLKRITITMAIIIVSCLVLYFLSGLIFTLNPTTTV